MSKEDQARRLRDMSRILPFAHMDHRHLLDKNGKLPFLETMPRNERRKLVKQSRQLVEEYRNLIVKMSSSGCKFPVDKALRDFGIEYNHRYATSGTQNQPVSFNYLEPFFQFKLLQQAAPSLHIETEFDHLFSIVDFFDYLTEPGHANFDIDYLNSLPEAKIFHFTANGNVMDLRFLTSTGNEFVVSGFSFIRRGISLYWYLVGGEIFSKEEWDAMLNSPLTIDMKNILPSKRALLQQSIQENGNSSGGPIALEGTERAFRTVIAGEMNLTSQKHVARCIMSERENTFNIVCDDPEIINDIRDEELRNELIKNMMNRIEQSAVLWNLANSLFELPKYFTTRVSVQKEAIKQAKMPFTVSNKGGRGLAGRYTIIPSLIVEDAQLETPPIRKFVAPHYSIETEGHWRRLEFGKMGHDRDGTPVKGRTWVKSNSSWRERATTEKVIYVKDPVAVAKQKKKEIEAAASELEACLVDKDETTTTKLHTLYVLRCAAMEEQVYKVGWSRRSAQERAIELSNETGVPLSFTVVKSWSHSDAEGLEKEVHMMLVPYRLNERREFFKAPLPSIIDAIESCIGRNATRSL